MLDIKLFREHPEAIRKSQRDRFKDPGLVDKVIEWDNKWRDIRKAADEMRARVNKLSKEIGQLKKKGQDTIALAEESKRLGTQINQKGMEEEEALKKRDEYRYKVSNILHESVPIAKTDEGNVEVAKDGTFPMFAFKPRIHPELVETVGGVELKKAQEVVGSRFYYLKNDLTLLNIALIHFGIDFLVSKGYKPMWTPFFINYDAIKAAAELADFEEQLYEVKGEDPRLFLIATSEQTLAALHKNEVIDAEKLPLKYCGISTCFRREAGAHGKDTSGIFRIHQFEKIEQFVYANPETSWQLHEEMIGNSKEIFTRLGIPFRVVNIASGEMNDNAAKKYDLEGWFPGSNAYRELVSCSNCTDYQARKLNIKYGKRGGETDILHTLNSTAIATERTICCILENYQNEDGSVRVPDVLQPYMGGKKVMKPWA
ncbi:MAG: serine--tRNA ligase [Candidatus Lokiarchaeota archaeon]|nr:serine--tRNA ligase [Candidatus Lokiarchaeota archaeon]